MEFVRNVKRNEVNLNYIKEFKEYLTNNGLDYNTLSEVDINRNMVDFLYDNIEINDAVMRTVASAYHNGVLRSIMIRQPNEGLVGKSKTIKNILFFPTRKPIGKLNIKGLNEEDIVVDAANLLGDKAVFFDDQYYSVREYVDQFKGNRKFTSAYADFLISKVLIAIDNIGVDNYKDDIFKKKNTIKYYVEQLSHMDLGKANMTTNIIPIKYDPNDDFTHKFELTKQLLQQHSKERILVFFDYDLRKKDAIVKFVEKMKEIPEFKERLVEGLGGNRDYAVKKFNAESKTIANILNKKDGTSTNIKTTTPSIE